MIDPGLPPGRQPERLVFASPRLTTWLQDTLPGLGSSWNVEVSPAEQAAILFEDFCAGEELEVGNRFHVMRPGHAGVWELKTPDLRFFGWFHRRDCFIAHIADDAGRIKGGGLYTPYREEVVRFRRELDLDEPKFVPGEDPYAVVSNYHFP